ncbi:dermonecrotic toxin domain-containing protein [Pseudomonas retamae]|uniref:Dermonecrotic toxin domain-containing protein n=1 Tax=Pseudomonas retamae TaxID=702110 RepID=A0ABW7DJ64_9PSED
MHLSQAHPSVTPDTIQEAHHADAHYQPLKEAIAPWLGNTSTTRRETLKNSAPQLPEVLKSAPADQHALMKTLGAAHIEAQSQVDKSLEHLQDAAAFAEPLLKTELKSCFDLDLDVRNTFVRLYIPATTPLFPIKTGARVWSVSLLDAALHNFEDRETHDTAFEAESTFTTAPTPTGQFDTLPAVQSRMSIPAFAQLCRRLDIGAKYKASLEEHLGYSDPMVATVLRNKLDASQKTAMKAALQWARMNRDVSESAVRLIEAFLDGMKGLYVNGAPLLCHDVSMLCAPLTGIVVFAPDLYLSQNNARVVAYVPDDPEHPFKEYTSPLQMIVELTRQLRSQDYQRFFSRFVNHEQRGFFFSTLNSRLSEIKWHPHEPGSPLPAWREAPVERPDLQTALVPFHDDLWQHLHQAKLNKVFNDARVIAVPTAVVDQKARWAFWDSVVEIISTIAQTAALIVAPFVPVLGEAMMAYMAYQMLDEAFEGIVEWGQGRTTEAFQHLMGTVESMIQLGMFAVGGAIASTEFRKVLPKEVVAFIDRFKPVKLANGETRYWEPDLERYKHPTPPPADSQPNQQGLHSHQGKQLLPLEEAHFSVKEHEVPGQYRIEHPTRPDAYQPVLRHNGDGAWHTELEQPMQWDGETALRRIGPAVEGFTPAERETILQVSGSSEEALRKMHVNQEKTPPLLADSIQRFKIDQQLQRFIDQLDSDIAEDFMRADQVTQLQLLSEQGRWPSNQRLRLIDRNGELLWQSSADASLPLTELRQDQLIGGDLLKTLLSILDDTLIKALLAEPFTAMPALDVRSQTLRKQLVGLAKTNRSALFESRYQLSQQIDDPLAQQLQTHTPQLPASITRELLDTATGSELLQINDGQLPPRQQELAQLASQEVRVSRAYEGLELGSVNNPDSDSLALHSLKLLPGWSGDVRIEIRTGRYEGAIVDSIGREDAAEKKVLVRSDDNRYQAFDDRGQELHSLSDFYSSLLYALPDSERSSLNIAIGQGQTLKAAIRQRMLGRDELRVVLHETPIKPPDVDTLRILGSDGFPRIDHAESLNNTARSHEQDIRALYPRMSEQQVRALAENLRASPSGPRVEIQRLQNDYLQLQNDLHLWANDPPARHPDTGAALTSLQKRAEIQNRRLLREEILSGWRREYPTAINQHGMATGYALRLVHPIIGDLPTLSADLSHITALTLDGSATADSLEGFLQHFPQLQLLDARNLKLPALPQVLTSMASLRELRMRNCRLSLTITTQSVLASMPQLTILDLQGNALGLPPDLLTMPSLRYVNLSNTGIHGLPDDLLHHPRLISGQFDGNRMTAVPEAFFRLPPSLCDGFTFADNPLTPVARERVKRFHDATGRHFGIRPERADLQRTSTLFPALDEEQATAMLYRLPGTLAEGRAQLTRWEIEVKQLNLELSQWINQAATSHPETGERLPQVEQSRELDARRSFAQQLERFWRSRDQFTRSGELEATAEFSGDMPVLSANFEHVLRLKLTGNANISASLPFVDSFPNLVSLSLNGFDLATGSLSGNNLPQLTDLKLKNCGVVMTPEHQAALVSMNALQTLNLSNNPLGTFPDLNMLPALTFIDLSNSGLTAAPEGLAGHPQLRTAVLTGNHITDIPDAVFGLPAERSDGLYFSDNPLSTATREKIKTYYRTHHQDFDVRAPDQDVSLAQQLFPELDQQEASDMLYDLPGELADGRAQLLRWQAELAQMQRDLDLWVSQVPSTHPTTGRALSENERTQQRSARTAFKQDLESFWRRLSSETGQRSASFVAELNFMGQLPRLNVDFSHVSSLKLTGNAAINAIDPFVALFPKLEGLQMKDFALNEVPAFIGSLRNLKKLRLDSCAITSTSAGTHVLKSLRTLTRLDLSNNPLTVAPDLQTLPALQDVFLLNSGLTAVPDGMVEHPALQTVHLNDNLITQLPDAFFSLNRNRADGVRLAGNPLSVAARERIKIYYAQHQRHFGIMPAANDVAVARRVFPHLTDYMASDMIYRLPGTLQASTAQLMSWEAEMTRLLSDLAAWQEQVPSHDPTSGQLWSAEQRATQLDARSQFKEKLEGLWRGSRIDVPDLRVEFFKAKAAFAGELPELSADFSQITHLEIQGNPHLTVPDGFLDRFTGLEGLELPGFALGRIPRALERMPSLETLMMSRCNITLDAAGQSTLSTLSRLTSLDLFNNPLGQTPDTSRLLNLTFIDLIRTGIDRVPAGLDQLPHLQTALLSDNSIIELPDPLAAYANRGVDVGSNPLSATSREQIKACYLLKGDNFGVWVEQADIDLAQTLYPRLSGFDANNLIYRLPGTLTDGRTELLRRHTELSTMLNKLETWVNAAPEGPIIHGVPENEPPRGQVTQRRRFKDNLEKRLRHYPVNALDGDFTCDLSFTGELPQMAGRFDYIDQLRLTSTASTPPPVDALLELFPRLRVLDMRDYPLGRIPPAIFRLETLSSLNLSGCELMITPLTAEGFAALKNLGSLDLNHNNRLGTVPDMIHFPDLQVLNLRSTGLTRPPAGLFRLTRLRKADLSNNRIKRLPLEFPSRPDTMLTEYDFSANPLTVESQQRLDSYNTALANIGVRTPNFQDDFDNFDDSDFSIGEELPSTDDS